MSRANLQAKSYVKHINIGQTVKQSGRNANVRKQEEEIAVGIVFVIVRRGEVAAGPHGTTAACLRQKKAVCKTGWPVLASIKTICNWQLGERRRPQESRNGSHKLLFGDGTVESASRNK